MSIKQDTFTYELKKGRDVVYRGTTNDFERREAEHRADGKDFDKMIKTSRKMSEESAKKNEAESLATYRKNHGGKNPKYNKDPDG